jgi:hypothetical protein
MVRTPVIPALRKWRQRITSSRPAGIHSEVLPQKTVTKTNNKNTGKEIKTQAEGGLYEDTGRRHHFQAKRDLRRNQP